MQNHQSQTKSAAAVASSDWLCGVNELPRLGIAQVATEAMLSVQLGIATFETIERECRASVYWPEFCTQAKAGEIPEAWLQGALGRVVLGWAKAA